jgi:SAM-dependent methyltransferase
MILDYSQNVKSILKIKDSLPQELHGRLLAVANWSEENLKERYRLGGDQVKLCNIGCGFGWLELHGLKKGWPVDFLSVEPSESDLKVFKELVTSESVTALVASGLDIPIADSSVDLVVVTEVLEHIPKNCENLLFKEVFRILAPGGSALITTPKRTFRSCIGDPAFWLIGHRHYAIKDLEDFAANAGFKKLKSSTRGSLGEFISTWDLLISKWIFRRQPILGKRLWKRLDAEWSSEARHFMGVWMVVTK